MDKSVGSMVWICSQPAGCSRNMVDPIAGWAGVHRTVKLAGLEKVNEQISQNDVFSMRAWRLDGVLVSNDDIKEEEGISGSELTTSAVLVAFKGPARVKNVFSYRPMIQDIFYVGLVFQQVTNDYVWKPFSSQLFADPLEFVNVPLLHRSVNSAIPPPTVDKTPLELLTVDEIPHVVGAYRIGQVLDSSVGSCCIVDVDISWVSWSMLRKMHGPSQVRLSHTGFKQGLPWPFPKDVNMQTLLKKNSAYFVGRSLPFHLLRTIGPGYKESRKGFGGRKHPRCGAGLNVSGKCGWQGGVPPLGWIENSPDNCGFGPLFGRGSGSGKGRGKGRGTGRGGRGGKGGRGGLTPVATPVVTPENTPPHTPVSSPDPTSFEIEFSEVLDALESNDTDILKTLELKSYNAIDDNIWSALLGIETTKDVTKVLADDTINDETQLDQTLKNNKKLLTDLTRFAPLVNVTLNEIGKIACNEKDHDFSASMKNMEDVADKLGDLQNEYFEEFSYMYEEFDSETNTADYWKTYIQKSPKGQIARTVLVINRILELSSLLNS